MATNYDVIIVGGGPAGLSLACLAGDLNLKVAILDKQSEVQLAQPPIDGRDIALTHRSVEILRGLGVWAAIAAEEIAPIKRARVINADQPHQLRFDPDATGVADLGYLVGNHVLRRELYRAALKRPGVVFLYGAAARELDLSGPVAKLLLDTGEPLKAKLLVAADSRFSETRRQAGIGAQMRDFGRTCIVCRMQHDKPHDGTAYEWFDTDRTLAALPLNNRQSSLVITQPTAAAAATMRMPADAFAADITQRFNRRWGEMQLVGDRHAYPLVAVYAERFAARHFALIGDAAVGMHPVTAHGFNFGLMGAHTLAARIGSALRSGINIAAAEVLDSYDREHRLSTYPLYAATNAIVRLYTDNGVIARALRSAVLRIGDRLTPFKDLVLRKLTDAEDARLSIAERFMAAGTGSYDKEARSKP